MNGVFTDSNGQFSITVNDGAILEVSSIGFISKEVKATANLKVTLEEDS